MTEDSKQKKYIKSKNSSGNRKVDYKWVVTIIFWTFFISCTMPDGFDGAELASRAKAAKVTVVPGVAFATDDTKVYPTFRLNFSLPSLDEIERGIDRLAKVVNEYVG